MADSIRSVMTPDPITLDATATLVDAAQKMREYDIGDVLVEDHGAVCGLVTDRDIVVRALAERMEPASTRLGDICTHDLVSVAPDDDIRDAVEIMSSRAIRRLPVVEQGRAVGMVSIGDLAVERDPQSALADISASPPNN